MLIVLVVGTMAILALWGHKQHINTLIYMLMVPLAACNTDNNDRYFNEWTYNGVYRVEEPGFKLMIALGNKIGIDFQTFFAFIMCLCILLLFLFVSRLTTHVTLFGLLYLIYPFPLLTSGIRVNLAYLIVLNAIFFLKSKKKYDTMKYILIVLIAGTLHFSALIFLVFFLCNARIKKKNIIALVAVLTIMGCLLTFTDVFTSLMPSFLEGKASRWLSGKNINGFLASTSFHLLLYFVFYIFYLKMVSGGRRSEADKNEYLYGSLHLIARINDISLLFIVFYCFNYLFFGRLYIVIEMLSRLVFVEAMRGRIAKWRDLPDKASYIGMFIVATLVFTLNVNGIEEYIYFWSNILNNNLLLK